VARDHKRDKNGLKAELSACHRAPPVIGDRIPSILSSSRFHGVVDLLFQPLDLRARLLFQGYAAVKDVKGTTLPSLFVSMLPQEHGIHTDEFAHEAVNHQEAYVDGEIHTNGVENYVSVQSPHHGRIS
jgi:hypothetical protein